MTNISKKNLTKTQETVLTAQFFNFVSSKSSTKAESILVSLMGYEEKMMLVKRFAVIVMLWRKYTMYEISKKLIVSTSTVARIERDYRNGKYIDIVKMLENKGISILAILEGIDSTLHLGGLLPHYGMTHKMEDYKKFQEEKRNKNS